MDPSINPFLSTTLPSSIGVNAPQGLPPSADAVAAARQPGFGSTSTLASTSASSGSTAAASTAAAPTIPSDAPGKALEPLTEGAGVSGAGGIFDKALGMAMPYVKKLEETTKPYTDKLQETTKPYTDAATAKAKELVDRIEGTAPPAAPVPPKSDASSTTAATERGIDSVPVPHAPSTATGLSGMTPGETGEKAKHLFGQGLSAVQNTFTQLTHTIDEKTKSPTHPGILTQAAHALEKGVAKVEKYLDEHGAPVGMTTGMVPPGASGHPVQTTTNSVPHPDSAPK